MITNLQEPLDKQLNANTNGLNTIPPEQQTLELTGKDLNRILWLDNGSEVTMAIKQLIAEQTNINSLAET